MRSIIFAPMLLAQFLSAAARADDKQTEIDKHAYKRAQKAGSVKTWDAAIAILEKIDIDKVDDEEVIEYVAFSLKCAKTADELGIDRASNPASPSDVIGKIDWGTIVSTLAQKVLDGEPGKVVRLLNDARKTQKQIPHYLELDEKLTEKYGD